MKKTFLIIALCLGLFACNNNDAGSKKQTEGKRPADLVEVLFFYGKQRCTTCKPIQRETQALVSTTFAEEVKNGNLVFKILDIDENEALAEKYQITWSSLVLVDCDNGEEKVENMTNFAFGNARKSPDTFRSVLAGKINEMLN